MDLRKTPNKEKARISRIYFMGGFAFLPFLWLVNTVWFFQEAFFKEAYEEQKEIRKNVLRSLLGTLVWIGGLTAWIYMFQTNRASWGELGDKLSFLIPLGEP